MSVAENIALIRGLIGATKVTLIAVTKNVGADQIEQAFNSGVTEYGENRVQDALIKQEEMPTSMSDKVQWHFIGRLQSNKVKKVVGRFALIHSVDSISLAEEVSREAQKRSVTQSVLLQVKVLDDPSKGGFSPEDLRSELGSILQLPNIAVKGLMTIAPLSDDVSTQQRCFEGLRQLRDELQQSSGAQLTELSMGMTDDWQEAIKCGATMVRIGRAIFGDRAA